MTTEATGTQIIAIGETVTPADKAKHALQAAAMRAISDDNADGLAEYLSFGADPTPLLRTAIDADQHKCIKALIPLADVKDGQLLAHTNNLETIKMLLDAGADPNAKVGRATVWVRALQFAIAHVYQKLAVVQMFIAAGADPCGVSTSGNSILSTAAAKGDAATVKYLLTTSAITQINVTNDEGETPLHRARSDEVAVMLLKAGADPNVTNAKGEYMSYTAAFPKFHVALTWKRIVEAAETAATVKRLEATTTEMAATIARLEAMMAALHKRLV